MMDREAALAALATDIAEPVSKLLTQLESMLSGLAATRHFDITDNSALGSAIHSALPSAVMASGIREAGWDFKVAPSGPGNKLTCSMGGGGSREVILEVHLAGPRGGVGKSKHQFATEADGASAYLPGFEIAAPSSFLMFLGLVPDPTYTSFAAAYLMYADRIDKRCVQIDLLAATRSASREETIAEPKKDAPATKVRLKKTVQETRDAGSKHKRGDGSSGA